MVSVLAQKLPGIVALGLEMAHLVMLNFAIGNWMGGGSGFCDFRLWSIGLVSS